MNTKNIAVTSEPEVTNGCFHYWKIESANGPVSIGVCKFCGEKKEFYNSLPEFSYMPSSFSDAEPEDEVLEKKNKTVNIEEMDEMEMEEQRAAVRV